MMVWGNDREFDESVGKEHSECEEIGEEMSENKTIAWAQNLDLMR